MTKQYFNPKYPTVDDLKRKAKKRMPQMAFDYLVEGCNSDVGLKSNNEAVRLVKLQAELLKPFNKAALDVTLFGHRYAAPFGIAPVGLQGLMWPKTPEILAKAAAKANIPFILSTVSSSSLESIAEISEGQAWFQLYNPTDDVIRYDLLKRIKAAHYPVLVITVDVPTFGFRPRDIRNGLSMPPKPTLSNLIKMLACPSWLLATALAGKPEMQTLKPYMPANMPIDELANFMNKTVMGRVDRDSLKKIRDHWQGPLVIKGVMHEQDVASAIALGADAVIISNHGARQLDVGEASIVALQRIVNTYKGKIKILMDSGLSSGPDIACAMACGAEFTFLGRAFIYSIAALGKRGGDHIINSLFTQLEQIMNQLRCATPEELPRCFIKTER